MCEITFFYTENGYFVHSAATLTTFQLSPPFPKRVAHAYVPRDNSIGGNFCGHDPENPRWHLYEVPASLLLIQKKAQKKIKAFYSQPDLLPRLSYVLSNGKRRSTNRNGQFRQVDSNRREHIALVLLWVVGKLNFANGKLGYRHFHDGQTHGIAIEEIATALQINYSAVQEALSHLYHADYMEYEERYENRTRWNDATGKKEFYKRRIISVRTLKAAFFADIGMSYVDLEEAQRYAAKKWERDRAVYFAKQARKRRPQAQGAIKPTTPFSLPELPPGMSSKEVGQAYLAQLKFDLNAPDPYIPPD